jgi:hypothetical protein
MQKKYTQQTFEKRRRELAKKQKRREKMERKQRPTRDDAQNQGGLAGGSTMTDVTSGQ